MKGFTLVEVLIALAIIGTVLLPVGKFYQVLSGKLIERQQRATAIRSLENQEALLRRTPYADLPRAPVTLPVTALPGGVETLTFAQLPDAKATTVAIAVRWQGPGGEKALNHTLVLSPYGPEP